MSPTRGQYAMISHNNLEQIPLRFQNAARLAVQKILEQPDVIGFVLAGSVAQGTSDEHSDLDFYVITNGNERWRLCWMLENVPVEVFFNPFTFLQTRIEHDAAALQMLATGIPILEHPELRILQEKARGILTQPPKVCTQNELEFDRFNTMEYVFETRSVFDKDSYPYFVPQALVFMIKAIYRKNRWWDVKPKHILTDLQSRAPELAALANTILNSSTRAEIQTALETLAKEIINPLEQIEFSSDKQTVG
jgi:predicted nucleotidyltransferase